MITYVLLSVVAGHLDTNKTNSNNIIKKRLWEMFSVPKFWSTCQSSCQSASYSQKLWRSPRRACEKKLWCLITFPVMTTPGNVSAKVRQVYEVLGIPQTSGCPALRVSSVYFENIQICSKRYSYCHHPTACQAKLLSPRRFFTCINPKQCTTSTSINNISKQQDLFKD